MGYGRTQRLCGREEAPHPGRWGVHTEHECDWVMGELSKSLR